MDSNEFENYKRFFEKREESSEQVPNNNVYMTPTMTTSEEMYNNQVYQNQSHQTPNNQNIQDMMHFQNYPFYFFPTEVSSRDNPPRPYVEAFREEQGTVPDFQTELKQKLNEESKKERGGREKDQNKLIVKEEKEEPKKKERSKSDPEKKKKKHEIKIEQMQQHLDEQNSIQITTQNHLNIIAQLSMEFDLSSFENNVDNLFELYEQPNLSQRKCYQNENRCILPNPLSFGIKKSFTGEKSGIKDGIVTAKLISPVNPKKSNPYLESASGMLTRYLDSQLRTAFPLKIMDIGTDIRLVFCITYTYLDQTCVEIIFSNTFSVFSNTKNRYPKQCQLPEPLAKRKVSKVISVVKVLQKDIKPVQI